MPVSADLDLGLRPAKSGARLRHRTRRNELCRIADPTRPLQPPFLPCGECQRRVGKMIYHTVKTYHLWVDGEGYLENVSVSAEVFSHLSRLGVIGPDEFEYLSDTADPPTIMVQPSLVVQRVVPFIPGGVSGDTR